MLKYYLLAFAVVAIALAYAYVSDPCHQLVRMEFSSRYPAYEIVDSEAHQGSREKVQCRISYRKPGSDEIHQQVWMYIHEEEGWEFSRVVEPQAREETP